MATATIKAQTNKLYSPNISPLDATALTTLLAGRYSQDKVIKEFYWCKIIEDQNLFAFLGEYMGKDTSCFPNFSVVQHDYLYDQIKLGATGAPFTLAAYPTTTVLPLDVAASQFGGAYILPQVGNSVAVPPYGELFEVTAVNASGGSPTVSVKHRNPAGVAITGIVAGQEMVVLAGKYLADCACPDGSFRIPGMPTVYDLSMVTKGSYEKICGDALLSCQNFLIPFFDENGNESPYWFNEPLKKMYKDFEKSNHYEMLLNYNWGLIPVLKSRGSVLTPTSTTALTEDDIYFYSSAYSLKGVTVTEFAVAAGRDRFIQYQKLFNSLSSNNNGIIGIYDPAEVCKTLNMNWCTLKIGGFTLHVFEDKWMSTGLGLGNAAYKFRNAAIWIPLIDRTTNVRNDEVDGFGNAASKMLTTVYFKESSPGGRTWDALQDENGLWASRNNGGAGCDFMEWSVKSRFAQIIHCPEAWGLENFV